MTVLAQMKPAGSRALNGADRVAALLLSLEKPIAAKLLKHFDPDQLRQVTRSVAGLKPVVSGDIDNLIEDFSSQFVAGANLVGTTAEAEKLLDGVLPPEKITEIMLEVQGNADRTIWERLSSVSEDVIAEYIIREHPQTAALILAKVKSATAAKVLEQLNAEFRNGLIRRMLSLKAVADGALRILERTLHEDFAAVLSPDKGANPHARMAEIINKMDREAVDQILDDLINTRPKAAEALRSLLFTFEDIIKLNARARAAVLDKAPNDAVVTALRGAAAEVKEAVLQALGTRVRRMVEQELSNGQAVAPKEIKEAQKAIAGLVLEMAGRGEIDLTAEPDSAPAD